MNLRSKVIAALTLLAALPAMAATVPISLSAPDGSGLKLEYDATTDVYTLTATSSTLKRYVRTDALAAPFVADIRFLKFDYISTKSFTDLPYTLYKAGSKGTATYDRTFNGEIVASNNWQSFSFDARATIRGTVRLGGNAGQYMDLNLNSLLEGQSIKIRHIRWASDEEPFKAVTMESNSEATVEAEDFNTSDLEGAHASRQILYPAIKKYKNPTGNRFPVYAWGYMHYRYAGIEDGLDLGAVNLKKQFQEMAECGFTCTQGTPFPGVDYCALFSDGGCNGSVPVDLFEGLDMWMIVKAGMDGEPELAAKYRNSPRLAGYFIEDEPHLSQFPGMRNKIERIAQYDDDHMFYGNLLSIETDMKAIGATSYENYVQEFVRQVGTGTISFDYYPVRINDTTGKIFLKPNYFKNLEVVAKLSKYYGQPFWSFVHSVASECGTPNETYPTPTEEHMRVQAFLSLAYGAQGIQYFTYLCSTPDATHTYYDAPLDVNGNKTPIWDLVKAVNTDIHAMTEVFLGAEMIHVGYTHATTPEGCMRLTADMLPAGVTAVNSDGSGVCVSLLQNGTKRYLMIVNPDLDYTQNVTVALSAKLTQIKTDGSKAEVSGDQNVALTPGGHLVYLVDENAPVAETYEQPAQFDRAAYRSDADDVIIANHSAASGEHFLPDMGDRVWNVFSGIIADDANHVITEADAMANWGSYYNYFVTVADDMEVNISIGHSVPWSEYGRVASTGAKPGYGYMMENNPLLNWPKAYAASMRLELDGTILTPANQPLRPAVPETFDPAGSEFNRILADKSQWVSTANADGTPSNVLYFWPKEGGSDDVEFVYNEQPDYQAVKLTAGEHKLTVRSLCYPWHFDAIKLNSKTSGIAAVADEESEVVATQYFDLQGRMLQAAPESGLYLRRDIRANGTATTAKIVK